MGRHLPALSLLAGLAACSSGAGSGTDLVRIAVSEGTSLAFDLSRNDSTIAFDLLGQIWALPAAGGEARAITDAVRDTADESHPALSPDGRIVVFAGERAGHAGLWLVDIASGQVRRLTTPPQNDDFPAWSPDGSRIAFIRDVARMEGERVIRFEGLHLIDTAGGEAVLVPLGDSGRSSVRQPAWSADGRKLYVTAPGRDGTTIWEVDLEGGSHRAVGDSSLTPSAPAPAPDGRTLAFLAPDSSGRVQVWVHDLTTRNTRRLTDHPEITAQSLRWNRDGTALVYVANGRLQRHELAADTARELPFTARLEFARARPALPQRRFAAQGSRQTARGQFGIALSPSGKQIAILALGKLWIVPVDGAPRELTTVPPSARDVEWAPSEQQVAYSVGEWGEEDIVITDVTTGRTHPLTALPAMEVVPRWSPDGRWIAFVRVHPDSGQKLLVVAADAPTLRSLSAAKNLGEPYFSEWAIGLGRSAAPVWRADSRALLVHHLPPSPQSREPFGYVRSTVGEVVPLEGPRRKLAHFPLQPTDEQWIDDTTFVFLQADRIWRARFSPDSGMIGSPAPLNDDPALYLSAARDGSVLYVSGDGLRLHQPSGTVTRLGWPVTYQVPVQPPLVVRNAKVLDGTGAPPSEPRDLLVRSGRIERIAPAGSLDTSGARVVDAEGGIVMPGLADLHFHYDGPSQLRGQLYHGITLVRDQGSDIGTLAAMAEGGATGAWDAPRISFGGFQVYSDWAFSNGLEQGLEPEQDSAHVSRVVALLTAHGADHMKIRTFYGWTTASRLVQAAHRAGLRTTGHCVLPLPLLAAGMDAQEHSGNNCGSRLDAPYRQDVQDLFRATDVSVVPSTIMYTWWGAWLADKRLLEGDDIAPFLVPLKRNGLDWLSGLDLEYWVKAQGPLQLGQASALHRAGVPLGVGADAPILPYAVHLELERLVEAGLTPLEAIRAGTETSARITGHDAELGTVAEGKLADLLLLEPGADPSADIRATRRIRLVILGGRPIEREALKRVPATSAQRAED